MAVAVSERPHGTRARYVLGPGPGKGPGCRCEACTAANRQEAARASRLRVYGRWAPFVDADAARAHVQALGRAGIGWRRVAALAGVSTSAMSKLLYGGPSDRKPAQRIRPATAAAILAVRPGASNLGGSALVDATGTHRRLHALVAVGWSQAKLAARLGMSPANFAAMMRRAQVTASTARAAAAVYDELWNQRPPEAGQREKIAAARARNYARARGWIPPLAWDDDQIDLPDGKPAEGWRPARPVRRSRSVARATPGRRRGDMSIEITEDQMTCDLTGHTARRGEAGWQVSWLPGRTLTRNQATTAMVLGEVAAQNPQPGDRVWPFAVGWAAELGLPGAEAIRMARGQAHREAGREARG
jgi:transcriptional regulator with XRE-family HTH domain